jgi:hypothetical protein
MEEATAGDHAYADCPAHGAYTDTRAIRPHARAGRADSACRIVASAGRYDTMAQLGSPRKRILMGQELSDPLRITHRFTHILDKMLIRYMVGGSLASSLYGIPRATQDVDVVAAIQESNIKILCQLLAPDFFIDEEMMRRAVRDTSSFNIIDKEELFKIDVFIAKSNSVSDDEMNRRILHSIADGSGQALYICSPEDIIAHKLYWYQLGGCVSERQWNDALSVLKIQKQQLDMKYLMKACLGKGVSQLLEKALAKVEK